MRLEAALSPRCYRLPCYALDTTAILAFIEKEPGVDQVRSLLLIRLAGEIKALFNLPVADAWIVATAIQQGASLVHKDPEFEQLKNRVTLSPLPYKPKAKR